VVRHASYASAVQKNEDREGDDHQHNRAIIAADVRRFGSRNQ
jgi:hypothetical protein